MAELTSTTPQRGPTSGPTGNASTGYRPRIVEHGQLRQGIQVAGSTHPTPNAIDGGQDGWQELWNTNSLALQVASKLGYRDHGPALKVDCNQPRTHLAYSLGRHLTPQARKLGTATELPNRLVPNYGCHQDGPNRRYLNSTSQQSGPQVWQPPSKVKATDMVQYLNGDGS